MADDAQFGPGVELQVPPVPAFIGTGFQVVATDKDVNILLSASRIGFVPTGDAALANSPIAQITVSMAAAKELLVIMEDAIKGHEAQFGTIETAFLRQFVGTQPRS